ncbi:PIN domain-containing protein [Pseudomonas sp. sp1636]|uniref:PIN domain-containing protein n=1 Tax=Pseudomonas sp. sp1636 TaxID=3036707 RepID=UPI0025A4FE25|nr:PIN domain-containing protein [Pseudomonas sp. sp1636]MDM8348083.1 PIN domain-containing protein [Pseudomonas sp. sp1636]
MANHYALIDLENIQPASLQRLKKEGYRIKVFVGATQSKIAIGLAVELQSFGSDAEYIQIEASGKNALDFHIAFYMGRISASDPESRFVVLSKDTGYDPLLKHMRGCGIPANRSGVAAATKAPTATPVVATENQKKSPLQMSLAERVEHVRQHLNRAGKAKPAKLKTLDSAIKSLFQKKLDDSAVTALINELIRQGLVIENQGSVSYKLTKSK